VTWNRGYRIKSYIQSALRIIASRRRAPRIPEFPGRHAQKQNLEQRCTSRIRKIRKVRIATGFLFRSETQNQQDIMEPENVDIESITDARRKAIEQTIEPIGIDELKSLGEKLFPFLDHPWRQTYFQFLEDNSGSAFYHAATNDQVEIIYCPDKEKGIWFVRRGGMGPLQAKGIDILNEIVGRR
jgi:hypothetical protein